MFFVVIIVFLFVWTIHIKQMTYIYRHFISWKIMIIEINFFKKLFLIH